MSSEPDRGREASGKAMDSLDRFSALPDDALCPARVSLAVSAAQIPGRSLPRYESALDALAADMPLAVDAPFPEEARVAVGRALFTVAGYRSLPAPTDTNGHPDNSNMIRVMDERAGSPAALAVLGHHVLRTAGWAARILDCAGRLIVRIGPALLIDVAEDCRVLQAPDLRRLVKAQRGPQAELSATFYTPLSNREIVLALFNPVKFRLIADEEYESARGLSTALRRIAPGEYRLLLDHGILCLRTNDGPGARESLTQYVRRAPPGADRDEALFLLGTIGEAVDS
ncbi:MAG: hypothetical protein KDJ15_02430 [Alphaproteobacteria bacterium]|nr:hypothetical protein [Alphaproteobacteria bacterium]